MGKSVARHQAAVLGCKGVGVGGIHCSCCSPLAGKNDTKKVRTYLNRRTRRKEKQSLHIELKTEL